jgi:hypothetical protein
VSEKTKDCENEGEGEGAEGIKKNACANCSAIEQRHRNVVGISQSVITFPSCSVDR